MTAPQPPAAPGAPTDAGTGSQAQPGTQQPQNTQITPTGQHLAPGAPADQTGQQPQDVDSLPDWAQKIIRDSRASAARDRTAKQNAAQAAADAQAQRDAVLKVLGVQPDGTDAPPDPAAIQQQVEHAQAAAWTNALENQLLRMKGIDADRLWDSRAFIDSLDDFVNEDVNSPDFKTTFAAHVKGYVQKHPQFLASSGSVRSGADLSGGPGQQPTTLDQQIAEAVKARDFTRVIALKRQRAAAQRTT